MAEKSPTALAREAKEELVVLRGELSALQGEVEQAQLIQLRERLAVVESQVHELRRVREESEKRHWQFVYIFAGAMASLLVTVIVQLVLAQVKK